MAKYRVTAKRRPSGMPAVGTLRVARGGWTRAVHAAGNGQGPVVQPLVNHLRGRRVAVAAGQISELAHADLLVVHARGGITAGHGGVELIRCGGAGGDEKVAGPGAGGTGMQGGGGDRDVAETTDHPVGPGRGGGPGRPAEQHESSQEPTDWMRAGPGADRAEGWAHRVIPVWPSEYRPGCGHTHRPCGWDPTGISARSCPVKVDMA